MRENRIGLGHLIGAAGALVALISLWLPWLRIDVSKLREEPAFKAAEQSGSLDAQIQAEINRFISLLPDSISGNGWDIMQRTDIAFALGAAAVIALVFATVSLGADSLATAKIMLGVGMAGMLLMLLKLGNTGVPDQASSFVSKAPGFMVALVGWTICAAGGVVALWNPAAQAPAQVATPEPYVAPVAEPAVAPQPIVQAPVIMEPEVVPLTPEYKPDPAQVSGSIAPPPRG
jgi:hypothetical protein